MKLTREQVKEFRSDAGSVSGVAWARRIRAVCDTALEAMRERDEARAEVERLKRSSAAGTPRIYLAHSLTDAAMTDEAKEIECATKAWRTEDGTPVEGHVYVDIEEYDYCHVTVSRCENCGHLTVGWYHMDHPPQKFVDPQSGDKGQIHRKVRP